jgi:hypothetical protein
MYAKVFSSMFDGTLATVGPWEALVTFQQMLILADKFGVVDMTAGAISRRTTVPLEIIEKGIKTLEEPDPYSRNEALEGRRIKRLADHRDWGWEIVNFQYYNSIRSAEDRRNYQARYQREYRRKRKQNVNKNKQVNQTSTQSTEKTPHTQSYSYTQKNKDIGQMDLTQQDQFREFWDAYPRKVKKKEVEKIWMKINPSEDLFREIMAGLVAYKKTEPCLKGEMKFIRHPSSWLNGEQWEDEAGGNTLMGSHNWRQTDDPDSWLKRKKPDGTWGSVLESDLKRYLEKGVEVFYPNGEPYTASQNGKV